MPQHKWKTPEGTFANCVKCSQSNYQKAGECTMTSKTWAMKVPHDWGDKNRCKKCNKPKYKSSLQFYRSKKGRVWRLSLLYVSGKKDSNTTYIDYHCPYTDDDMDVKDIIL